MPSFPPALIYYCADLAISEYNKRVEGVWVEVAVRGTSVYIIPNLEDPYKGVKLFCNIHKIPAKPNIRKDVLVIILS
jgi:hypothetical protein